MKQRVDILAFQQGLFETREKAKRGVMAGIVVDDKNERHDKPGEKVPDTTVFRLKGKKEPYVSRGGYKLAAALDKFNIDLSNLICLDIGSSTGGFTDVALQHKAKKVYALDVGTNQLAWKLRDDNRVIVMEQQNFRYSKKTDFVDGQPEFAMTDVSFISLTKIITPLNEILPINREAVLLIKPQFEAGKDNVGKNGIVKDIKVYKSVISKIIDYSLDNGFDVIGLTNSPIHGMHGNREFLIHIKRNDGETKVSNTIDIDSVISEG